MDRRQFLLGASGVLGSLAGCGEPAASDPPAATGTPTEPPTDTLSPTRTEPPTDTPTSMDTPTPTGTPEPTATEATDPDQVVLVGPDGAFRFDPASFTVQTGDTVKWTWESGGHNVVPASQPSGADWEGTPDGPGTTYPGGYTDSHTFETAGAYEYYCAPHRSVGMTGSFTVE